jgi:hypothetical protein
LDTYFWQHQSDGLALCIARDAFRYYRLPLDFKPFVGVSDRFHLKPLLSLFRDDGRFYVLALSQDQVRLLHGTRYSVSTVNLDSVPESLADALKWDDPERQLQLHAATAGPVGPGSNRATLAGPAAIFHGHGLDSADVHKEQILRYFHRVDEGLSEVLSGETAPLVIAAVDFLHPMYQQANSYSHLLDRGIAGNPEHLSAEELHDRAWAVVQPVFAARRKQATELYQQLSATGSAKAVRTVEEAVPSAYFGRVGMLFVAVGAHSWGTFDAKLGKIELHGVARAGDEDLLDLAAVHTTVNNGIVFAVEPQSVPSGGPIAAILRY